KRYFRKFSFLLNRLRRPSNHLPISGRRILQRSNSLSSTSVKLRFEPLPGPNRCGEQPAGALHHPWERIHKSLIYKHLLFVAAGSGAHYREIETGVNTYLKLFNPKVRKPRGRPIPPL
ncbi:hypothetical protein, partial [Pseudomonas aeruginosa]|uniref:hypothetical protein n=1 Tax=Pseudomonas aeruginosa TaxID=287 RepID=UPI001EDE91D9